MSTAGAPGPSPERVEGPTAPCGMRPTPTTQNCTLLGFRVQPPCLPPSSGEKELMAWLTSKPIFAIKFLHCFSTGPEGALEASPRIWATRKFMNILIAKQSKSKGETHKVILGVQLEASELTDCQFHMVPRKSFCSGLNCGTYKELLKRILGKRFIFDKNPDFQT